MSDKIMTAKEWFNTNCSTHAELGGYYYELMESYHKYSQRASL